MKHMPKIKKTENLKMKNKLQLILNKGLKIYWPFNRMINSSAGRDIIRPYGHKQKSGDWSEVSLQVEEAIRKNHINTSGKCLTVRNFHGVMGSKFCCCFHLLLFYIVTITQWPKDSLNWSICNGQQSNGV